MPKGKRKKKAKTLKFEDIQVGMKLKKVRSGAKVPEERMTPWHAGAQEQALYEMTFGEGMIIAVIDKNPHFRTITCTLDHCPLEHIRKKFQMCAMKEYHLSDWEVVK